MGANAAGTRRKALLVAAVMALSAGSVAAPDVRAEKPVAPINRSWFQGVAIHGYDPVAYFLQGRPTEGKKDLTAVWQGATWRFASAGNRDLFTADPERYAPQFGGYCAYAVSQGLTADIDPNAWRIVDGKLYLNLNKDIQAIWEQDIPGYIQLAEVNWPRLLKGG